MEDGWDRINRFLMLFGLPDDSAQVIAIILGLIAMYGVAIARISFPH